MTPDLVKPVQCGVRHLTALYVRTGPGPLDQVATTPTLAVHARHPRLGFLSVWEGHDTAEAERTAEAAALVLNG